MKENGDIGKIVLLEKQESLGGRVKSDYVDGYILDRGFAVFIEEYPMAKKLLDYEELNLKKFWPGAKIFTGSGPLKTVVDPLRVPSGLFQTLFTPIGTMRDKTRFIPLFYNIFTKSIDDFFVEEETDTLTCLKERYKFSDKIIGEFFKPFLTGIFLVDLNEQSSRMFHFVLKMFATGCATLPSKGMSSVTENLRLIAEKKYGVDVRPNTALSSIKYEEGGNNIIICKSANETYPIRTKSIIIATDVAAAHNILASNIPGFEEFKLSKKPQPQSSVGCLYYGFDSEVPIKDPILILNGASVNSNASYRPINTVSFPSVVNSEYAPKGHNLCSVSIPQSALESCKDSECLDNAVRAHLKEFFPDHAKNIDDWKFLAQYVIPNAQPRQLGGPQPANVYRYRSCCEYRGISLPHGIFICGDHMSTPTLNGALESGYNAGIQSVS
eukprot:CAMPEP_0178962766 /NCGR_PEP_ID=MMETSP0789-20121207/14573_1 /TAXON_ID=3005 /ORGANISM="Rhizosolenia setigera, Strain CCMP 1694" /LENGTH=439 /DNA_ID=CAMNT_0020647005 /DNA_START=233 /DNA_END=1552 /DNA_ORIENTATION=-